MLAAGAQIPLEAQALVRTQRGVEGGATSDGMPESDGGAEDASQFGIVRGSQRALCAESCGPVDANHVVRRARPRVLLGAGTRVAPVLIAWAAHDVGYGGGQ